MSKLRRGKPGTAGASPIGVGSPIGAGAGGADVRVDVGLATGDGAWTAVWFVNVVTAGAVVVGLRAEGGDRAAKTELVGGTIGGLGVAGRGEGGAAVVGGVLDGPGLPRWVVEGENDTARRELAVLADLDRFPELVIFEKILEAVEPLFSCLGWNVEASEPRRDELPDDD